MSHSKNSKKIIRDINAASLKLLYFSLTTVNNAFNITNLHIIQGIHSLAE